MSGSFNLGEFDDITGKRVTITILGYGKVGSHLYYALNNIGSYKLNLIKTKNDFKDDFIKQSNIIFITTQDSKIKEIVKKLFTSKVNLNEKFVYHTSGVLNSDILNLLKKKGAKIGSFHPVQTFESATKRYSSIFKGIYIAVEGDKEAIKKAALIARNINSIPIIINKRDKVKHHICCVISSNYTVSFMYQLNELKYKYKTAGKIQKNGFNKRSFLSIYEPLMNQTIANIKTKGAVKSLTGPIERGDLNIIRLHLSEIKKKSPVLLSFYKFLGRETAKLSLKKRSIEKNEFKKLLKLLE